MTKTIRVRCRWDSTHDVEVPDDYVWTGRLDDAWADQVYANDPSTTLVDWWGPGE